MNTHATPPNRPVVHILALPESSAAVLYGFFEVLSTFAQAWTDLQGAADAGDGFEVNIVAQGLDMFTCSLGVPVHPHRSLADGSVPDVVIVTDLAIDPHRDHRDRWPHAAEWLRDMQRRGASICSVCSGSVLLASAGLLDGQPATTHWAYVDHFEHFYPEVNLRPEQILLPVGNDNRIVTAGGMSAWEDLALYLIAYYFGEAHAINAAKLFVFGDRCEGQLLYAARIPPKRHEDAIVAHVQEWMGLNYDKRNCVSLMVEVSGLPERTFKRRFRKATGCSPLAYLQTLRIEEAKQILLSSEDAIDTIPGRVGYEDSASFGRLFKRATGVTPGRYRQKYRRMIRATRAGKSDSMQTVSKSTVLKTRNAPGAC
jgi:transcriptional regulator GlxA family with amidase domain